MQRQLPERHRFRVRPSTACAQKAHIGVIRSVPKSVPERSPTTIIRQPTPTKFPIKNGPEIIQFQARSVIPGSLSKPPPSASRPPHRGEKAKYKRDRDLRARRLSPRLSLEWFVPATRSAANGDVPRARSAVRMQRFFSPTTMPATDGRTSLCWHEPASTDLVDRGSRTRSARGSGARAGLRQAPVS